MQFNFKKKKNPNIHFQNKKKKPKNLKFSSFHQIITQFFYRFSKNTYITHNIYTAPVDQPVLNRGAIITIIMIT